MTAKITKVNDLPDHLHEEFGDLCDKLYDKIYEVIEEHNCNSQIFLNAVQYVHICLLSTYLGECGKTSIEEQQEFVECFRRNLKTQINSLKKPPGI